MLFIDFVFILILCGFALFGFWFGLVHTLGSLAGTLVGTYIATRWYGPMAEWLINITGWDENTAKVIMFVIAFVVINRLVGFGFWVVDKLTEIFTSLPFIRGINRFLGVVVGLFEGAITLGLILYFIDKVPLSPVFMERLAESKIAPYLVDLASILLPLIPDALQQLESQIDYVEGVFRGGVTEVMQPTPDATTVTTTTST